jgi:hypothetical protein
MTRGVEITEREEMAIREKLGLKNS